MFRLWIEWDYGQEDAVFTTEEKAMAYLDKAAEAYDNDSPPEDRFGSGQGIIDNGLAGILLIRVDPTYG